MMAVLLPRPRSTSGRAAGPEPLRLPDPRYAAVTLSLGAVLGYGRVWPGSGAAARRGFFGLKAAVTLAIPAFFTQPRPDEATEFGEQRPVQCITDQPDGSCCRSAINDPMVHRNHDFHRSIWRYWAVTEKAWPHRD